MAPRVSGILVGVDGSGSSDTAIRWAVREAVTRHEALTLMAVAKRQEPLFVTYDSEKIKTSRQAQRSTYDRILAAARQIVDDELGGSGLGDVSVVFRFAHPLATLIEASKRVRLVVVGCRGVSPLDRLALGSVSNGLVRHAHCPVAVIHEDRSATHAQAPILLGIDGSPASEFATAIAFEEASARRAPLIAMHAWSQSLTTPSPLDWMMDEQKAHAILSERLAGWREDYPDVDVTPVVIKEGVSCWLVDQSDTAQLIVVGSRGRHGFAGMALGSVSAAVVQAAEVPVIVARGS